MAVAKKADIDKVDFESLETSKLVETRDNIDLILKQRKIQTEKDFIKRMKEEAKSLGIQLDGLIGSSPTAPKRASYTVHPKYKDPATGKTHSGRGKPAKWMLEHVSNGGNLEDLLINKD